MGRGGRGSMTGTNFLRNFLFLKVTLRDPSTLTAYWSNCLTSMTVPVLSHLSGCRPVWFCTLTWSPTFKGGSLFVWRRRRSACFICLCLRASSLPDMVACHMGWGSNFAGRTGMKSLICLPNMHWAGEIPVTGSGVFLYCSMAFWNLSVSRDPSAFMLSISILFMVLTPTSALQLLCGKAVDDCLWCIPQLSRNFEVSCDVSSGPPSDASSSAIPNVTNIRFRHRIKPLLPPSALSTTGQFEYLSTTTR